MMNTPPGDSTAWSGIEGPCGWASGAGSVAKAGAAARPRGRGLRTQLTAAVAGEEPADAAPLQPQTAYDFAVGARHRGGQAGEHESTPLGALLVSPMLWDRFAHTQKVRRLKVPCHPRLGPV
jgi:hypothetical protein